jgi:hypothetical protein
MGLQKQQRGVEMTVNLKRWTRSVKRPLTLTPFWPDTRERIAQGRLTPFISNYMSAALFGVARGELAARWAADIGSPFGPADNQETAYVAQYYAVTHDHNRLEAKQNYLNALTDYLLGTASEDADVDQDLVHELTDRYEREGTFGKPFSEIAKDLGYPRFDQIQANPFRMLAELPLPIYITTSHHRFLEYALTQTQSKKHPVTEIFYWNDGLESIPSIFDENPGWEPSVEQPLVYHLYGLDQWPESMALTEDDFLDLLDKLIELRYQVKLAENTIAGSARRRRDLPAPVRTALSGTALLMLGYSVDTWEFRVFFRGLIRSSGESRHNRNLPEGICMQIKPGDMDAFEGDAAGIMSYLEQYFKGDYFRVFWGSVDLCVQMLYNLWQPER